MYGSVLVAHGHADRRMIMIRGPEKNYVNGIVINSLFGLGAK
jgi:hypothetical protein